MQTILRLIRRGPPWQALPGRPHALVLWRAGETESRPREDGYVDDGEHEDRELRPIDELMARGSKRRRDTFVERPPALNTRRSASVPDFSALVNDAVGELRREMAAVTVSAIVAKVRMKHPQWSESTALNYFYAQFDKSKRDTLGIVSARGRPKLLPQTTVRRSPQVDARGTKKAPTR